MARIFLAILLALGLVSALPVRADESATQIQLEVRKKMKAAQEGGKDVAAAQQEYDLGTKSLKDGMQEDAVDHFKKAKAALPN